MSEPVVLLPLREPFVDERGVIQNLVDGAFGSVAVIESKKGAIRANHYHKTDFHFCWLQRGALICAHRPAGQTAPARRWTITAGQLFYTPPEYEHAMQFTEDSVMIVVARNHRGMADYEADTIRISSIL